MASARRGETKGVRAGRAHHRTVARHDRGALKACWFSGVIFLGSRLRALVLSACQAGLTQRAATLS
jgi:hypothetical protein